MAVTKYIPLPYMGIIATVVLLRQASRSNAYPIFRFLPPILSAVFVTQTSHLASSNSAWNMYIDSAFGVQLVLEFLHYGRLTYCSGTSYLDPLSLRGAFDLIINRRKIGTPHQVRNTPDFDSNNPAYVPSRTRFLLTRLLRIAIFYVIIDFATSQVLVDPEKTFSADKVFFFDRVWRGEVSWLDAGIRIGQMAGAWIIGYWIQSMGHDIFSVLLVSLGLYQVKDCRPRFGNFWRSYTIRAFWG